MDTRTGELRPLEPGEELPGLMDHKRQVEVDIRRGFDPPEPPPEVEVPASYLPLTPAQRLALAFGSVRGKDRKAGQSGHQARVKRQRRAQRKSARKGRR